MCGKHAPSSAVSSLEPPVKDFLGLRDENPPLYPQLAYVPIFGELVAWHATIMLTSLRKNVFAESFVPHLPGEGC